MLELLPCDRTQIIPMSSGCSQLCTPMPLCAQFNRFGSVPVQRSASRWIDWKEAPPPKKTSVMTSGKADVGKENHFTHANNGNDLLLSGNPSCLHTTLAAFSSNLSPSLTPSLHTVPQSPLTQISNRPSVMLTLPTNLTAPLSLHVSARDQKHFVQLHTNTLIPLNIEFLCCNSLTLTLRYHLGEEERCY